MAAADLSDVDAVVNLSGVGLGDKRWTTAYKRDIVTSRLDSTRSVVAALEAAHRADGRTRRLLSASAVGFYGDRGDEILDEHAAKGSGFLAELVRQWEDAASEVSEAAASVVLMRTGLVCDREAELITRQLPLFKFGLGGRLGSGKQYWPIISLRDHIRAQLFLLADSAGQQLTGPVNLAGPEPVTNATVTKLIGEAMHRPAFTFAPAFALRIAIGEFAPEGVLVSQRVIPAALSDAGFHFDQATARAVIKAAVA